MKKKLQFRGISRLPSDRMTADGGCAESLNVLLKDTECTPALRAEDITFRTGLPGDGQAVVLYIHKTASFENFISYSYKDRSVGIFTAEGRKGDFNNDYNEDFLTEDKSAAGYEVLLRDLDLKDINDIASIGNTLVISTKDTIHHFLFFEGKYEYLGDKVPFAYISVIDSVQTPDMANSGRQKLISGTVLPNPERADLLDPAVWKPGREGGDQAATVEARKKIREYGEQEIAKVAKDHLIGWCYIRYAVRLFDGSYTSYSVPVLVGAGYRRWLEVTLSYSGIDYRADYRLMTYVHKLRLKFDGFEFGNWRKFVQSVDVFMTKQLYDPNLVTEHIEGLRNRSEEDGKVYTDVIFKSQENYAEEDSAIKARLLDLDAAVFYRIASIPLEKLPADNDDLEIPEISRFFSNEYLVTQPTLPDDYNSQDVLIPSNMAAYNSRIIYSGLSKRIGSGYPYINSCPVRTFKDGSNLDRYETLEYKFYLKDSQGGENTVISRYQYGTLFKEESGIDEWSGSNNVLPDKKTYAIPYTLFFFPNPNCYKVQIRMEKYRRGSEPHRWDNVGEIVTTIPMEPHPRLNCSYAYMGVDKKVSDIIGTPELFEETQNRIELMPNKLYLSEVNNLLKFQPENIYTVSSGQILNVAMTARALSTGQFGQFPLYVFTTDGIWVMDTAEDGTFRSSRPLSREVMINSRMLVSLDQAVVFLSDKGVMLLSGSEIKILSPDMDGKPYEMPFFLQKILQKTPWGSRFMDVLTDRTPFMEYMRSASGVYDYRNGRLIFYNGTKNYQYILSLNTQTWHKLSAGAGRDTERYRIEGPVINSYPDCYVNSVRISDGKRFVLNMSVDRNTPDVSAEKGVIVTRPFDLGEPDVYKIVENIRLRGTRYHSPGKYAYLLLGSNDGHTFRLTTLRHSSYKLFVLVIVLDLEKDDTLSWVELDFRTKFMNRLR